MKLDRLLAMTMLLVNRGRVNARELADRFEVSIRTIYRDMETLNMAGIPVVAFPGMNGGFGILDNFKMDRNLLTADEMVSMVVALKGLNSTMDDQRIECIAEKLKGLIPESERQRFLEQAGHVIIDFNPWGSSENDRKRFACLKEAIADRKIVSLSYFTGASAQSSIRLVEPMNLIYKGYSWYLLGYCRLRNDFRMFKLMRIRELDVTAESFSPRPIDPPILQNLDSQFSQTRQLLKLRFSPHVESRVRESFGPDRIENEKNGSLLVTVHYPEDEWVYGMILSYGPWVEVLEPIHIRSVIQERAKSIVELYKS